MHFTNQIENDRISNEMNKYPSNYDEFKENFYNEKQCIDYLYSLRWKNGFLCKRCNCNSMWQINEGKYKCKECGYQTTIIAGTLLQGTHIQISKWFEAIWYIVSQRNREVSAIELQNYLSLGNNRTALNMLAKIRIAMEYCESDKLHGNILIDDIHLLSKRSSLETNGLLLVEMNRDETIRIRLCNNQDVHAQICKHVEKGSTIDIKNNRYYSTVPVGYKLIQTPQIIGSHQHPKILHIYRELINTGLYGGTNRSRHNQMHIYYSLVECHYKYNRQTKCDGELFYELANTLINSSL